ncbi:MAG: tetratricopeptide repeat protein [Caldilineales bacterium]|nr:tetratricopeptide repeat protein [Caldilineales bacterium]
MLDGQGDRRTATDHYQQSVAIFREMGDQWALTHPLCDLALRTWDAGQLHQAMALLRECLAVFRQLRSHGGIDMVLGYLTFMAVTVGDLDAATRTAEEKAEIGLVQALQANRAYGLHSLAHVNLAQGRLDLARQQLEAALPIALAGDNHGFKAEVLLLLGRCAVYAGAADEAAARLAESQRWAASAEPAPWREAAILFGLGQVACLRSDFAGATARYQESLHLVRDIRPDIPPRLEGLAQAALGQGQPEWAATLLAAADHLRTAIGAPVLPVDHPGMERLHEAVAAALSGAAFHRAWASGRALSVDDSVAYALQPTEQHDL